MAKWISAWLILSFIENESLVLCHIKFEGYRGREHSSLLQAYKRASRNPDVL